MGDCICEFRRSDTPLTRISVHQPQRTIESSSLGLWAYWTYSIGSGKLSEEEDIPVAVRYHSGHLVWVL